jgi:hypothetical protein
LCHIPPYRAIAIATANPALAALEFASTKVTILDKAAFLFVPPAPSSTTIKSDVVKSAPISVAPSMFKADTETLLAVLIVPNFESAILLIAKEIFPEEVIGEFETVNSPAPLSAIPIEVTVPVLEGVTCVYVILVEPIEPVLSVVHKNILLSLVEP